MHKFYDKGAYEVSKIFSVIAAVCVLASFDELPGNITIMLMKEISLKTHPCYTIVPQSITTVLNLS